MKRLNKDQMISFRSTLPQYRAIKQAADDAGMHRGVFVLMVILGAVDLGLAKDLAVRGATAAAAKSNR